MKKNLKYIIVALSVFILTALISVNRTQADPLYSRYADNNGAKSVSYGQCGDNVYWSLINYNGEGILIITGQGDMDNYLYSNAPWYYDRHNITQVIICEGVTRIGSYAFYNYTGIHSVTIGPDVKSIGNDAFYGCSNIQKLTIPNQVTSLGWYSLATGNEIHFAGTREEWYKMGGDVSLAPRLKNVTFAYDDDYDLSKKGAITLKASKFTYNSAAFTPEATVTVNGATLKKDTDYTLTYTNNTNAGKATVTATGKGSYKGSVTAQFDIDPRAIKDGDVSSFTDAVYTGSEIKPSCTVSLTFDNLKKASLRSGTDYNIAYKDATNVGKATVTITGRGNYTGTVTKTFQIKARSIDTAEVTNIIDKSYTGEAVTQTPTVRMKINSRSVTLRNGQDYSLSYKNNKSAGKATITITGQGNYTGSVQKTFNITKGSATVTFEYATVTKTKIGATFTNKVTTASKGKKSYQSSNSNVAKVNSKGEVTTKGYGQATITVTVAATDDFKESTAKYTVIVNKVIGWADLRYSFCNSSRDFGYSKDYTIPYARYKMVFGNNADSVYRQYGGKPWGGNCFGMSTSSALMNNSTCSIKVKEFKSSATKVSDLKLSNHSDKHDLTLKQYIEVMQISQYSSAKSREIWTNYNDLDALVKAVKDVATNSQGVVVAIYSDHGGHAMVGYEIEKVDNDKTRLRVYDPNFPDEKRSITLYTKNGKYTGWYYKMNDTENWGSKYEGCWISFNTYSVYKTLWDGNIDPLNSFVTNSQNFEILDNNGKKVAEMNDGVFSSEVGQIREMIQLDVVTEDHVIEIPVGNYSFVNKQEDMEELTLSTADTILSVSAENTALTATINTDRAVETVELTPDNKEDYQIRFDSLMLQEQGIDELVFTGVGKGDSLMVGVIDGQYVYENCEEMQVMVNGEVVEEAVPGGYTDPFDDEPVGTGD